MSDFTYQFELDGLEIEQVEMMQKAFEAKKAAMGNMGKRHRELKERHRQLQSENLHLRARNQELNEMIMSGGGMPEQVVQQPKSSYGTPAMPEDAFCGKYQLWDKIECHHAPVHSVAMYKDSRTIATASWDTTCRIWDLENKEVVRTLGDPTEEGSNRMGGLYAVAFAKTVDNILGCASCDKSVYLWDHKTGEFLNRLTGHSDEVNGIDFHWSQQVMATAGDDCKCIVWDFGEGIILRTLDKHLKAVYGVTFLGKGQEYLLATASFDQSIRVYDMRDKQVAGLMKYHSDDVIGIAYSDNKQIIASGSDDGKIVLWDVRTFHKLGEYNTHCAKLENGPLLENEVKRVEFNPSGSLLAAACSSGKALVYDIDNTARDGTGQPVAALGGHRDCVFDCSWGVDPTTGQNMLVSASHDHSLHFWKESR